MAVRNIVKIDQEKCNGCGLCVSACAEGAIAIVDGKARLVSETYCDGLGACLGHCPQGAITIEQRESAEFDEHAVKQHLARQRPSVPVCPSGAGAGFACPGTMARTLGGQASAAVKGDVTSQLRQWPVQLHLVSPAAPYFRGADILLVADCVPFAMGDFHARLLKDKAIAVGCPKLDDAQFYVEKLADILRQAQPRSLTVVHMEVPCCSGLTRIAKSALARSGCILRAEDVTIGLDGQILRTQMM